MSGCVLYYGKPFVSKLSIQKMSCVRLQNRLDSAQDGLDAKLLTQSCTTFHSIFTDSTLFQSILPQSSQFLSKSSRFFQLS